MRRFSFARLAVLFAVALFSLVAVGQVTRSGHHIPFTGTLELDTAKVSDDVSMRFALFANDTSPAELWSETQTIVEVNAGNFAVQLGSVVDIPDEVFDSPTLYLTIEVEGISVGGRQRVYASTQAVQASGVVGLGSILSHTTHLSGATSIAQMQDNGFALCDGTTPASQGITGALITAAMPNLNGGRFLRGSTTSGTLQDDGTAKNGLALSLNDPGHDHDTMTTDNCNSLNGTYTVAGRTFRNVSINGSKRAMFWDANVNCNSGHYTTAGRSTGVTGSLGNGDGETRPSNMSVVFMMRVR